MKASKLFKEINELLRIHNATDGEIINVSEDKIEFYVDGVLEIIEFENDYDKIYYDGRLKNPKVLENQIYRNYEYYITTLGSHPCCYVLLPKGHRYYGEFYNDIPIKCHYGLTYSESELLDLVKNNEWVIGWDYAHIDDYISYDVMFVEADEYGHKYTLDELRDDVYDVINQLVKGDKNEDSH